MKLHPGIEDDKRFLIVSLKRLTNDEILQSSKSSVKVSSKMKASKVLSSTATKRKPESNAEGYMTRSKKSKTMTSSSNPISYAQKSSSKSSTRTKSNTGARESTSAYSIPSIDKAISSGYATRSKRATMVSSNESTQKSSSNPVSCTQKLSSKSSTTTKEPITVDSLPTSANTIALLPFQTGEIVWGKINGWPHWPAKITKIILPTRKERRSAMKSIGLMTTDIQKYLAANYSNSIQITTNILQWVKRELG